MNGVGCASEPIDKALPDFLNLGICHLDGMSVPYFDGLGLSRNLVRHLLALVDVGNGIVQGMLEEIDAIIAAELTLYGILVPDISILMVTYNGILSILE